MEIALDTTGRVLGLRGRLLHDLGAYALQDVNLPYNSASTLTGPYAIPAFAMEVAVTLTNKVPVSSVRGAAIRRPSFVMERLMDIAAHELGRDRAELRLQNLIPAAKMPYTKPLKTRAGASSCMTAATIRPARRRSSPRRIGMHFRPGRQPRGRRAG